MHITIINDCSDENVVGRQLARVATLTDASVGFIGLGAYGDMAAAGNLIDALDAHEGTRGAVLVNVAPRHGGGKKWSNGTPFCYFWHNHTLVIATFGGHTLSLVKKLDLVERVSLIDVHAVVDKMAREHLLDEKMAERVNTTQFRSFDFVPRVASYILRENEPPATQVTLDEVVDMPSVVWWVDNFGNVKTSLLPDEAGFEAGKTIIVNDEKLLCYTRLADVPDGERAVIIGSSGVGAQRFLEIVVQGKRACDAFGLSIGSEVVIG